MTWKLHFTFATVEETYWIHGGRCKSFKDSHNCCSVDWNSLDPVVLSNHHQTIVIQKRIVINFGILHNIIYSSNQSNIVHQRFFFLRMIYLATCNASLNCCWNFNHQVYTYKLSSIINKFLKNLLILTFGRMYAPQEKKNVRLVIKEHLIISRYYQLQ